MKSKRPRVSKQLFIPLLVLSIFVISYIIQNKFNIITIDSLLASPITSSITYKFLSKKDRLIQFYKKITNSMDTKNYDALYEEEVFNLSPWITKQEYITAMKLDAQQFPITSSKRVVHSYAVKDKTGYVDRTYTTCNKDDCNDTRAIMEYEYYDDQWHIKKQEPSDRAINAVNYSWSELDEKTKGNMRYRYGYGTGRDNVTLHFMAVYLTENPELLSSIETTIEKMKVDASRPVINYQPPAINIQQPETRIINNPAPIYNPAPIRNSMNCTTNRVGDYSYTNCF